MDARRDDVFLHALEDGIDLLPRAVGIYCILNRLNGRRYVGQAQDIHQRCRLHRTQLKRGVSANLLLRRDAARYGAEAFFFFTLYLATPSEVQQLDGLDKIELWFAVQFMSHDERYGYNLEVGHHRTRAARFRERERKLLRQAHSKYVLLHGVDLLDPIDPGLLRSWVPGS